MLMANDTNNDDAAAEERAGHHVKLHEYCSTDIDSMVQQHIHVRTCLLRFLSLPCTPPAGHCSWPLSPSRHASH